MNTVQDLPVIAWVKQMKDTGKNGIEIAIFLWREAVDIQTAQNALTVNGYTATIVGNTLYVENLPKRPSFIPETVAFDPDRTPHITW